MGAGHKAILLAILAAAALPLASAQAKVVPRAEQGSVPLLASKPVGLDTTAVVEPGAVAWREALRPQKNVRLLATAPRRVRPTAEGVENGTLLFGYQLSSGVAYCPRADATRGTARVQCFRDFDQDGRFDGAYVTDWESTGSAYLASYLQGLSPAANTPYERVDPDAAPTFDGHYVFLGFRKGVAQFRLNVQDSKMDNTSPCEPLDQGSCTIAGLVLRIEPQGKSARIALLETAPVRQIQITMTGASLPGRRR